MRRILFLASVLCAGLIAAGCQSPAASPNETARALANTDPCAERLHELSGAFLLYYAANQRLPEALDELRNVDPTLASTPFACPASEKPFVYNRAGLAIKEVTGRIIVYDAAPPHSGLRWAITIIEPVTAGPLITKVIAISENRFSTAVNLDQSHDSGDH